MVSIRTDFWENAWKLKYLMLFIAIGNLFVHVTNITVILSSGFGFRVIVGVFMVLFNIMIIYSAYKHMRIGRSYKKIEEKLKDGKKGRKGSSGDCVETRRQNISSGEDKITA